MENCVRLRKEYKITPESKNFKTLFGITNRKKPSVIYIKLNTWANYSGDLKEYDNCISFLNSKIKNKIKNELRDSKIFDTAFFYTPELKKTLYKGQSKFHACFEVTIKQKEPLITDNDIIFNKVELIINNLIKEIENDNYFCFGIKK